ncbi:AAA domain-containing protein [Paraburkholderia sp. UCT31]|uniref:RNA repair transcriptional activator RtcR n=1 Tax=Paraburkholderia sp. UCT31 TaxID=2615209 RepID=UPI001654DAB4|nr:RNA repair transcriptional activator RtcR [Paraburkholderia sp. UCT31]MBC8737009.1 AAA domain-containing protein [Paraburkholderia sp. UCT31]
MISRKQVVIGFLGTVLDGGFSKSRWERWRPTVSVCAHDEFPVARVELLLVSEKDVELAEQVKADIIAVSPCTDVALHVLDIEDPWSVEEMYLALHDFARGYSFEEDTDYFVHLATGTHVAQICLFALTESRHFPGRLVDTMPKGKKGEPDTWRGILKVIDLDLAAYDLLAARFSVESEESEALLKSGIVTRNADFNRLIGDIEKVCVRSSAPILLTGPTGAGKTQLAKRIYELRARRHLVSGAFVEVNCATLRGDNAMSTLFGHKKGAFTGAVTEREGLLRAAHNGTLLLDEIGELPLDEQAMLLRALEDKRFMPMGSDKEVESNFQLIAGTNKDLDVEVAQGRFRADLYARLNVWTFRMPGIAERPEDIEPNIDYELRAAGGELGVKVSFNRAAREAYLAFAQRAPWPGNFRDLSASVARMATLAEGGRIDIDVVEREIGHLKQRWTVLTGSTGGAREEALNASADLKHLSGVSSGLTARVLGERPVDWFDEAQLEAVFMAIRDTRSMAAAGRRLFAVSRTERTSVNDTNRVRNFLQRWDLSYEDVKDALSAPQVVASLALP